MVIFHGGSDIQERISQVSWSLLADPEISMASFLPYVTDATITEPIPIQKVETKATSKRSTKE